MQQHGHRGTQIKPRRAPWHVEEVTLKSQQQPAVTGQKAPRPWEAAAPREATLTAAGLHSVPANRREAVCPQQRPRPSSLNAETAPVHGED